MTSDQRKLKKARQVIAGLVPFLDPAKVPKQLQRAVQRQIAAAEQARKARRAKRDKRKAT